MNKTARRRNWNWKGTRLILCVTLAMFISLCFAGLASAHGGEGDELNGPAPAWMIGLTYVQLIMIPLIGLYLAAETFNAWLRPAGRRNNQGVSHDTTI